MSKVLTESKIKDIVIKTIDNVLAEQEGAESGCIREFVIAMCDGFARSMKRLNGGNPEDKISGRVKSDVLVHYQQKLGINFEIKQSDEVEEWMKAAKAAYIMVYSARREPDALVEAASRLMRKLPLWKHLPDGTERIHYRPTREIVRRFYSQMWMMPDIPHPIVSTNMNQIMDLNGNVFVYDMCPVTLQDYQDGLVEAVPKFPLEKI